MVAYLIMGSLTLTAANKGRLAAQEGVGRAALAKSILTAITLAATAYSRVLGQRLMEQGKTPVVDGTTPTSETPEDVARIQRQLKILQYAIPVHVAGLVTLSALMSEQQRTRQVFRGIAHRLVPKSA